MFDDRAKTIWALQQGFSGKRILVAGDLMLDRHLWGEVNRISPEAPVPVVRLLRETSGCGGAANVALNLAGLGARPVLAGFIGDDADGVTLRRHLEEAGVDLAGVVTVRHWPTITKSRVIGGHQQMLRLDREEPAPPPQSAAHQELLEVSEGLLKQGVAAVILSDYAKGALSETLCQALVEEGRERGVPVLVDPKGNDYTRYRGATALSPNRLELATVTRLPLGNLDALLAGARALLDPLALDFLAVTLSERGIALVEREETGRIPATAQEVYDVSGAGDTVIATLAAALASGLSRLDALRLANLAGGVVVGKVGTVPIRRQELLAACNTEEAVEQSEKIATLEEAALRVEAWRQRGERIVFTNGCFDLLHAGHVAYLEKARRLGARLIVGLNTDRSVRALKGEERPVIQEGDRARVLAALASVDLVLLFDEPTPLRLIQTLRPDVLAKGADYTKETVVGAREIKVWGGEVALVPLMDGRGTSRIIASIRGECRTPEE